jgi:hypothetical protein
MLSRTVDSALNALWLCRERVPPLRDRYSHGSPERATLDRVLAAIRDFDDTVQERGVVTEADADA